MKHSLPLLITVTAFSGATTFIVPSGYPDIYASIGAAQNGDTIGFRKRSVSQQKRTGQPEQDELQL